MTGAWEAKPSRTGALMAEVRRMPIFNQLVPAEAGVGWPLGFAARRPGTVHVLVPFYGMPRTRDAAGTPLYPPFSTITFDWRTARPIAFEDLRATMPWPPLDVPVGRFPRLEAAEREEYLRKRAELLGLYDELFDCYAGPAPLPAEKVARFRSLWRALMEPALEPYYRHLAPAFTRRFLPPPEAKNTNEELFGPRVAS